MIWVSKEVRPDENVCTTDIIPQPFLLNEDESLLLLLEQQTSGGSIHLRTSESLVSVERILLP